MTEGTIEERMLETLAAKHDLAMAAQDVDSDVSEVNLQGGMEALKRRLERLTGAKPAAAIDESVRTEVESEVEDLVAKREKVARRAASCWRCSKPGQPTAWPRYPAPKETTKLFPLTFHNASNATPRADHNCKSRCPMMNL